LNNCEITSAFQRGILAAKEECAAVPLVAEHTVIEDVVNVLLVHGAARGLFLRMITNFHGTPPLYLFITYYYTYFTSQD